MDVNGSAADQVRGCKSMSIKQLDALNQGLKVDKDGEPLSSEENAISNKHLIKIQQVTESQGRGIMIQNEPIE